jgi:hypothetical protein
MTRANSSNARARTSGTRSDSPVDAVTISISSGVNDARASFHAARIAASGGISGGCRSNASSIRTSMSSCSTTSSFVGK